MTGIISFTTSVVELLDGSKVVEEVDGMALSVDLNVSLWTSLSSLGPTVVEGAVEVVVNFSVEAVVDGVVVELVVGELVVDIVVVVGVVVEVVLNEEVSTVFGVVTLGTVEPKSSTLQ